MRIVLYIFSTLTIFQSCTKARKCECADSKFNRKEYFFINGTKKDSQKACTNMADSTEICSLISE